MSTDLRRSKVEGAWSFYQQGDDKPIVVEVSIDAIHGTNPRVIPGDFGIRIEYADGTLKLMPWTTVAFAEFHPNP